VKKNFFNEGKWGKIAFTVCFMNLYYVTVEIAVKNIQDVYQDRTLTIWTVKKWFTKLRRGDFFDDQSCSGSF